MALSVSREVAEAKSRLVHVALLDLNLRLMENWRSIQIATKGLPLDHESIMILMAIIVIGAEKLLRVELIPEQQTLAHQFPENRLSKVNFSSISAATAINRETVRRKVNYLEGAGMLTRDKDGIRVVHGVVRFEDLQKIIEAQLDAVRRTVNQLSKFGILVENNSSDR